MSKERNWPSTVPCVPSVSSSVGKSVGETEGVKPQAGCHCIFVCSADVAAFRVAATTGAMPFCSAEPLCLAHPVLFV